MIKKPIFRALSEILKFKDSTTVAELSKFSGKKQFDVLTVLNENQRLYRRDKKSGKIIGWHDYISIQKSSAFKAGKTYRAEHINYDTHITLTVGVNTDEIKRLQTKYTAGGFGDSFYMTIIEDTPDNRKALEKLGFVDEKVFRPLSLYEAWIEQ